MTTNTMEAVHISRIRVGDTVVHEGKVMTVCRNDLKNDDFMGLTLFGDCYRLGYRPVQRMVLR